MPASLRSDSHLPRLLDALRHLLLQDLAALVGVGQRLLERHDLALVARRPRLGRLDLVLELVRRLGGHVDEEVHVVDRLVDPRPRRRGAVEDEEHLQLLADGGHARPEGEDELLS